MAVAMEQLQIVFGRFTPQRNRLDVVYLNQVIKGDVKSAMGTLTVLTLEQPGNSR